MNIIRMIDDVLRWHLTPNTFFGKKTVCDDQISKSLDKLMNEMKRIDENYK